MFSSTPPVVKNLLIINILVFLAANILPSTLHIPLDNYLALYYWESNHFQPYQLVTHFFTHTYFFHLFFNMFALWMFGRILETVWGGKEFLMYYFITALSGALIYLGYQTWIYSEMWNLIAQFHNTPSIELFEQFLDKYAPLKIINPEAAAQIQSMLTDWAKNPAQFSGQNDLYEFMQMYYHYRIDTPMIGASGAVFGILLAFGWLFPNTELMLSIPPIPLKAKYFVIIYGAIELYAGINYNPGDNVAHFAHIGGMLGGFVYLYIRKKIKGTLY